ncbi:glycosyltransferase [Maridesulfovibrio sp.]|uniref:glycosyltransferase family 2 protein n=1 Tax=Maridesulfovibrio sp. TaxID=2795000 RepID=UPI0029F542A6|nr:glycosyltransferase [Maridesulfovibrio sp.]
MKTGPDRHSTMDNSSPKISVILPTYNRPIQLLKALHSLLEQSYQNIEVVVINDGSEDISEVVRSSGLKESGRSVLYLDGHSDSGPSAARNRGLCAATGEIIAYLDDDDVFHPEHISRHMEQYASPDVHVVYSDALRCRVKKNAQGKIETTKELVHSEDYDPDKLLVINYIPMICISHRRECIEQSGMFDESISFLEDWDLFIRLSELYDFIHVPEVTATYFELNTGLSVQDKTKNMFADNLFKIYDKNAPALEKDRQRNDRVWKMRNARLAQIIYDTGSYYEKQENDSEALANYSSAAEIHPTATYFVAMARIQKKMGLKKEALISMHSAQFCQQQNT